MKKLIMVLALLTICPYKAQAAIAHVAADCTGTSSCTTTGNVAGQLELAYATIDGSATAPSLATGWTSVGTASINGTSTNDSAVRLACKITTGSNEASNTFTNATHLIIQVYSGQAPGLTAACTNGGSIIGTANFFTSTVNTTTTTETFNAVTNLNSNSWDVGFGFAPAATAGIGTAPTGMINRNTNGTVEGGHDTNGGVSSFSSANVTLTTAGRIITVVVEIKANPCAPTVITSPWTCNNSGSNKCTSGPVTCATGAFSNALTSGSVVTAFVYSSSLPITITLTDTAGNTYNDCGPGQVTFNTAASAGQCYCATNSHTTASNAVTAHMSGAGGSVIVIVANEFTNSNGTLTCTFNGTASAGGTTSGTGANNITAGNITTTLDKDLIWNGATGANGNLSPGTSYTQTVINGTAVQGSAQYQASHGAIAVTANDDTGSDPFVIIGVAIENPGGSPPACSPTLTLMGVGRCG